MFSMAVEASQPSFLAVTSLLWNLGMWDLGKSQSFSFVLHLGLSLFVARCSFDFIHVMQDILKRILVSIRHSVSWYVINCSVQQKRKTNCSERERTGMQIPWYLFPSWAIYCLCWCLAQATYTKVRHPPTAPHPLVTQKHKHYAIKVYFIELPTYHISKTLELLKPRTLHWLKLK